MEHLVCRTARVLLGVSGSVAAIKAAELAHQLAAFADVKLVATTAARHFIDAQDLPPSVLPVHGMHATLCTAICEPALLSQKHAVLL